MAKHEGVLWEPDPGAVRYGVELGFKREDVIVVLGKRAKVPLWQVGLAAGLSPGNTDDEAQQRVNLQSSASKRYGKRRMVYAHIRQIEEKIDEYYATGGKRRKGIMPLEKLLEIDSKKVDTGQDSNGRSAQRIFDYYMRYLGGAKPEPDPAKHVASLVATLGAERARAVLSMMAPGLTVFLPPEEETSESDRRDGAASPSGVDFVDAASGGIREDGARARASLGGADASGADRGERPSREYRVTQLEERL